MGLNSLLNDTVTLLKKDGSSYENIRASIQKNKIFINQSDIYIESGDLIRRRMSNGGEETYEVIDPGFHESFHSIPAGYQMDVKKLGLPEAASAIQNITYNVNGSNNRINQNSTDNSVNIVSVNSQFSEQIKTLRNEINSSSLDLPQKKEALEIVDEIEKQVSEGSPSKTIIKTLLSGLPHIANVATIASSILTMFG